MFLGSIVREIYYKQYGENRTMIIKTAPFGIEVGHFRLFYKYFEEKVSDFLFVKSGSVIILFWYNLVANFAREYESSHDNNVLVDSRTFKYFFIVLIMFPNYSLHGLLMTIDHFTMYTVYKVFLCLLFQSSMLLYE
jgi:hypothetical protein